MSERSPQGDRRDWHDDEENEADLPPFKRLSAEEAQALREAHPSISPWRVVVVQAAVGLACAVVVGLLTRSSSMLWSSLYGAAVAVVPNALLARGMTRRTRNPLAAAAGFMFWEMVKVGVAIAMLLVAARVVPQLNWPVLLVTLVVCMGMNWFALLWRGR